MQITAHEIAQILNGTLEGNSKVIVSRPSKIEEGGKGTLTFLANSKYEQFAYSTEVSILLVNDGFVATKPILAEAIIRVKDVYAAVAKLLQLFENPLMEKRETSLAAWVDETALLGGNVSVGQFSVVEKKLKLVLIPLSFPRFLLAKMQELEAMLSFILA